jgi:hypothetical protein
MLGLHWVPPFSHCAAGRGQVPAALPEPRSAATALELALAADGWERMETNDDHCWEAN